MKNLLVFTCSGTLLGVWEEEISSLRDGLVLHRLPLSPAAIAGMSVLNDRTVTFADLSACLGLAPLTRQQPLHCLVLAENEKIAGFAVEGEVRKLSVSSDAVLPIPGYLRTAALPTCVALRGRPVPVVDITALYERVRRGRLEPPVPGFEVTGFRRTGTVSAGELRVITAGTEDFAIPAAAVEHGAVPCGPLAPLPGLPKFVAGLALYRDRAVPVISLSRRMGLPKEGVQDLMIAITAGDEIYGVLIDADTSTLPSGIDVRPLPPLAVCGWMESAVVGTAGLLPVIDVAALIAGSESGQSRVPLPERYAPDSVFPDLFLREEAEVTEFLLLGARHALPSLEVNETLPLRPWRPLPNVQPIVVGIARHEDRLLPVLDLAMIFGRRSIVSPHWNMMLVKNGDFEALVLTEAVSGKRRIPVENQRAVPILLPHHVVYGCYPDGGTVKLVLNVEALTVHFDATLVRGFMSAISKEMTEAPAEIVPALLPEDTVPLEVAPEAAGSGSTPEELRVAAQAEQEMTAAEAGSARAEEELLREAEEEDREEAELEERTALLLEPSPAVEPVGTKLPAQEEETDAGAVADAGEERMSQQEAAKSEPVSAASARAPQTGEEQIAAEERGRAGEERGRHPEEARVRAEEAMRAQEAAARREEELRQQEAVAAEQSRQSRAEEARNEEEARRTAEEGGRIEAAEQARREAEEKARQTAGALKWRETEERERIAPERRAREEAEEQVREEAEVAVREAEEIARREAAAAKREHAAAYREITGPVLDLIQGKEAREGHGPAGNKRFLAGVLGLILISVLLFFVLSRRPAEQVRTEGPVVAAEKKQQPSPAAPEAEEQLVLTVPKDAPVELDVYIVKQGDTLWAISKRFTGSPYNYPHVARDNKIANPDLIFPKQKIRIKREE